MAPVIVLCVKHDLVCFPRNFFNLTGRAKLYVWDDLLSNVTRMKVNPFNMLEMLDVRKKR